MIKDRQEALEKYKKDYFSCYREIDESLFQDKTFILELLKINSFISDRIFKESKLDKSLFQDKAFVLECVKIAPYTIEYFPRFKSDKDVALVAVSEQGYMLKEFSAKVRKDREIVSTACKKNGEALLYCSSDELKKDKELIRIAFSSPLYTLLDNDVKRLFHKYRNEIDILADVAKEKGNLFLDNLDIETINNPKFIEKIKDKFSDEDIETSKRIITERLDEAPSAKKSAIGFVQNVYEAVDETVMGRPGEHNDMWLYRSMVLAFTPIPYVHLVVKGGIAATKGIKTLGEHAYDKYIEAKQKRLEAQSEKKDNKQL